MKKVREEDGQERSIDVEDGWEFFVNDVGWAEMCAGFNPKTLAKTLIDMKVLTPERRGGKVARVKAQQRVPGHGKGFYYCIPAGFLNEQ